MEVVLGYKEHEKWPALQKDFDIFSKKVREFSQLSKIASQGKPFILNQLLLAVNDFDNHLQLMIKEIPEYYDENKNIVDNLLKENVNYMLNIIDEIVSLTSSKDN